MKKIALLTAAGFGTRMGLTTPKQFTEINGKPLIVYTMEAFQKHNDIDEIIVVTLSDWIDKVNEYIDRYRITKARYVTEGGSSGQESIYKGIIELCKNGIDKDDLIMIHDGNRCNVSSKIITDSINTFMEYGNAIASIPCVEAVFKSDISKTFADYEISRELLYRTQTPHSFTLGKLLWAHREARKRRIYNTVATCSLMMLLNEKLYFSKGSEENLKISTVEDLNIFKALLKLKSKD